MFRIPFRASRPLSRLSLFALAAAAAWPALAQSDIDIPRKDGHSIPTRVYEPSGECKGTIVFSHGAGGSRENGAGYFGEGMSRAGYLVLTVSHLESGLPAVRSRMHGFGRRALMGALREIITYPPAYEARFADIAAAREYGAAHCKAPFKVLAGHSMGAATVMMEAGAANKLGLHPSDDFDAYIALSPQGAGTIFPSGAWRGIKKPVLVFTGTKDDEIDESWRSRLQPFQDMQAGCKWQGVIDGATHQNFGGDRGGSAGSIHSSVVRVSQAFLGQVAKGGRECQAPAGESGLELSTK